MPIEKLHTKKEAQTILKVSADVMNRAIYSKKIIAKKIGGWKITDSELEYIMQNGWRTNG